MVTTVSERIVLKDLTCPIIRLDQSRRRDKSLSFSISLFLHALIFVLVGLSFIKPPDFGVDRGLSGMEVNLIAAPTEPAPQAMPVDVPIPIKSDFIEKTVKPVAKPITPIEKKVISKTDDHAKVTVQSKGGAISEAKPDYLKNPAPVYPDAARRRGYEGTVLLRASIDKNGTPLSVAIEKSSGHSSLDEAALKAVKVWKFRPGMLGNIPVESTVRVPVRFRLDQSNQ